MGTGFVLYLEDNDDLRELVVELVTVVLQRRCVGVGSYEGLVGLGEEALRCSVAILDINLGPDRRSGIDAYTWLRDTGFTVGCFGASVKLPELGSARRRRGASGGEVESAADKGGLKHEYDGARSMDSILQAC